MSNDNHLLAWMAIEIAQGSKQQAIRRVLVTEGNQLSSKMHFSASLLCPLSCAHYGITQLRATPVSDVSAVCRQLSLNEHQP